MELSSIIWFLVILLVVLAALVLALGVITGAGTGTVSGGADRAQPMRHLVIDGLNLIHWLHERDNGRALKLDPAAVAAAIKRTAPVFRKSLRDRYGLLIYVLKDRDGTLNDSSVRAAYQAAAEQYKVEITCVEQESVKQGGPRSHASRGRDDFYTCLLAQHYRCAVASEDRMRDFAQFRAEVPPFRTVTFSPWRAIPATDYVRPSDWDYRRLKHPRMVRFEQLLASLSPPPPKVPRPPGP